MSRPRSPRSVTTPKNRPTPPRPAARRHQQDSRGTKSVVALAALAIVVGVAVMAFTSGGGAGSSVTSADAFDLPRLGVEGRVTLASSAAKPTVVNMFASWCDQCDAELPDFHRAATSLRGEVNFVFVNSNETGNWQPMAERHKLLDFVVARDVGGTAGNGLYRSLGGTGGMPMTAFYDHEGRLIDVVRGALAGSSLKRALEQAYGLSY